MIAWMIPAPADRPYRGNGVDRPSVPLPPDRLPILRAGQLRKHGSPQLLVNPESISIRRVILLE